MTKELKTKLKLVHMVKEWLRTEHPEGNVQSLVNLILSFTEPKEKQIEIDAKQIRALQKQNGELIDRVKELEEKLKKETAQRIYNFNKSIEWKEKHRELEAQNEKMKCCFNCKHSRTEYEHCKTDKHEKWEIKEK